MSVVVDGLRKHCPLSNGDLEDLCSAFGTPLQIYDESTVRNAIRRLVSAFRSHQFHSFRNFFAVKALPNPAILALVKAAGCGFDCSSRTELLAAAQLGASGSDIMYTSNFTSAADLELALDLGAIINLDDVSVLETVLKIRGKQGCPSLVCFRLNPGVGKTETGGTVSNVLGGPESKFGMSKDVIIDAYRRAHAAGATQFGIHMMAGSCVTEGAVAYWTDTLNTLADVCAQVTKATGIGFTFINAGGGLGIPYKEGAQGPDVEQVASAMRKVFDEKLQKAGPGGQQEPKLFMENGRFITGPSGYLVTRCHAVKRQHFGNTFYGVDACMAHLMRPGMYGSYHHITIRQTAARSTRQEAESKTIQANVVGTLCENNDWFARDRSLPSAEAGDLIIIHDTGAHSHSMGFNYNGILRAPEILLRTTYPTRSAPTGESNASIFKHVDLIRRRETFETLYGNTCIPSDLVTPSMKLESQSRARL